MIRVSEIIRQARVNVLRDVDADEYQFNDKELLDAVNNTVQRALKLKPILQWTDTHTYRDASAFRAATADSTIPLPDDLFEALVVGTCEQVCGGLQADQAMLAAQQRYASAFVQLVRV